MDSVLWLVFHGIMIRFFYKSGGSIFRQASKQTVQAKIGGQQNYPYLLTSSNPSI